MAILRSSKRNFPSNESSWMRRPDTMTQPLNAIDLEVIYQSTLQIARELTLNMLRTGYSTIIKESQDFTFAIFDGRGRMVAQGVPQPLHIGPLSAQVNEIRRVFGGRIDPGDA